jgi:type III secretory pathway lipoprotein EscJ
MKKTRSNNSIKDYKKIKKIIKSKVKSVKKDVISKLFKMGSSPSEDKNKSNWRLDPSRSSGWVIHIQKQHILKQG